MKLMSNLCYEVSRLEHVETEFISTADADANAKYDAVEHELSACIET